MAQGQVVQPAGGDVLLRDGAVVPLGGHLPVEDGQLDPLRRGMKAPQGGGALPGGAEGRSPHRTAQLRQPHRPQLRAGEQVDVPRPLQRGIGGLGTVPVVVARGQEYGAGDLSQGPGQDLDGLPKHQVPVQQVPGEEHQVGLPLPGQIGQPGQQLPLLAPPPGGRIRLQAGKGTVQMEVSPVEHFQHGSIPFLVVQNGPVRRHHSQRSARRTSTHRFFSVSMVKRQASSLQGPSASSYRRGSPPRNRFMECSGRMPSTER